MMQLFLSLVYTEYVDNFVVQKKLSWYTFFLVPVMLIPKSVWKAILGTHELLHSPSTYYVCLIIKHKTDK